MARINVESYAFDDPRFGLLSGALRCVKDRWHAMGLCLRIWHLCANRRTDRLRAIELAACLGLRKPHCDESKAQVVEAFCEVADLGEVVADGVIRVRGTEGRTDYLDRRDEAKALPDRVVDYLSQHGPARRPDLVRELDAPRSTIYKVVHKLVQDHDVDDVNGLLYVHETSVDTAETSMDTAETSMDTAETVRGQSETRVPVPDPVPDPVLAPDQREGTHALDVSPVDPETSSETSRETAEGHDWKALEGSAVVPREHRRQIAQDLWRYQNQARAELDPTAQELPLNGVPGGSLDAIVLALATYSPRQCRHAIDMYAVEGRHLARDGDDPLKYLNGRTNWKPEQLERAVAATAAGIKKRYRRRDGSKRGPPPRKRREL